MIRFLSSHRSVAAAITAQPQCTTPASTRAARTQTGARRGFTLIEILIAMIVLGILAAMTVPTIKDYIAGANDAAMKDDLEKVMADGHLYFTQNNTYSGYPTTRVKMSPNNTLTVVAATATNLSLKVDNSASGRNCVHSTDETVPLSCQ